MDGYSFVSSGDGSGYYVDPNGNIVTAADYQAQQQQAITPQNVAAAYQQVTGNQPPPEWVEQTVAAYNNPGDTIQNVLQDTATAAVAQGTPITQAAIADTPSAWTQGYAQATGQPYQINDYTGTPTINVDANGNVTAWRGASGQIWTPASYNKAVATGQVAEPSNANPVDIAPLQNIQTPGILQSVLQGVLFVGGAALTAGLGSSVASALGEALGAEAGSSAATQIGNAVLQAAKAGVSGALSNQNPLISALSAGINPFVGSGVSDLLQGAGVAADAAKTIGSAVGGAVSGAGGALASGKTGSQIGQGAELGAAESGVSSGFQTAATEATTPDWVTQLMEQDIAPADTDLAIQQAKDAQSLAKGLSNVESLAQQYLINPELAKLLGIDVTTSETEAPATGAPGQTSAPTTTTKISSSGTGGTRGTSGGAGGGSSVTFGGVTEYGPGGVNTTGSPSTQALASALNVGSPSSATSDVPDPSTGGQQQNVWNQASLRVKDDTGSY